MTSEWKYSSDGRGTATFLHGWHYLHLEGTAYECGMQHGELLASYIGETIERMKRLVYVKTGITWKYLKEIIYRNWKDRIREEVKAELQGIVDGVNKTEKEKKLIIRTLFYGMDIMR